MGALHAGHLSLVERSGQENTCTVVSIFVNPTQFNQASDLEAYPRTEAADLALLEATSCQAVFLPETGVIYPGGQDLARHWDFGGMDQSMEGRFRPGHFDGVAQVVHILLGIVRPDVLYLGQKDYQQYCIVRRMVELEKLPVDVRLCPIVREPDGLAMSSRNVRLSAEGRKQAAALSDVLFRARLSLQQRRSEMPDPAQLEAQVLAQLRACSGIEPEYACVVDPDTLQPIKAWSGQKAAVLCAAVWVEGVRLIDNLFLLPHEILHPV
jgi:pantoate--beta-alanine ligase